MATPLSLAPVALLAAVVNKRGSSRTTPAAAAFRVKFVPRAGG
ncbi:MAG: hypothetical protein WB756_09285 [Xanthobacteraceae bacterium]